MAAGILEQIEAHALEAYPHECTGFIVEKGGRKSVRRIENQSSNPAGNVLNTDAWMQAEDEGFEVYMAYHSECDEPNPVSELDRQWADELKVPVLVYSLPQEQVTLYLPPGHELPYEGRPFLYGVLDCSTLFRDRYRRDRGIILSDEPHEPDFWLARDIWGEYLPRNGFVRVEARDARCDDLALFCVDSASDRPNQCGIWLGDGKNGLLIHPQGHESAVLDFYGYQGAFTKRLHSFWRHSSLC